jgi:hypothetical protein
MEIELFLFRGVFWISISRTRWKEVNYLNVLSVYSQSRLHGVIPGRGSHLGQCSLYSKYLGARYTQILNVQC